MRVAAQCAAWVLLLHFPSSSDIHHTHTHTHTHAHSHALSVYAKLKVDVEKASWRPEAEEQFEDSLGNVLDKKTYLDLRRQGLL